MGAKVSMPLIVDALLADTGHLKGHEFGAYMRLLVAVWDSNKATVVRNDAACARISGVTRGSWSGIKQYVMPLFIDGAYLRHADWRRHPSKWPDGNWRDVRRYVLERDQFVCNYCGDTEGPFDVDHIIPRSRGGDNSFENLTTACVPCNRSKGAITPDEWLGAR